MNEEIERILSLVERISFTVIALVVAIYLLNTVLALGQGSYGMALLNGISVIYVAGATILLLWVVANALSIATPRKGDKK